MRIATVGASLRHGHGEPAIMAGQQVEPLVVSKRHVAILAFGRPSAGVTRQDRREATAVLEQYDLLAISQRLAHGGKETGREWPGHDLATPQVLHVHDFYLRQLHALEPRGERDKTIFARLGIVVAFHGWRGRAEKDLGSEHLRHDDGRGAGVVARGRVLLLITRLMLLVDNDETELLERQEDGAASSEDDVVRIVGELLAPNLHTLAVAVLGMIDAKP